MKQDGYAVIQAGLEHLDLVVPLFDAYRDFYDQVSDIEAARKFLEERISGKESVIFLTLQQEPQLGIGFTQLYPSFTSVGLGRIWILYDLFVAPEFRRQGIGRDLMDHARQFARSSGALGVELSTAKDNLGAQALYEKLGYKRDEEFYHYELVLQS